MGLAPRTHELGGDCHSVIMDSVATLAGGESCGDVRTSRRNFLDAGQHICGRFGHGTRAFAGGLNNI